MPLPQCKKCGGALVDSVAPKSGNKLRYCPRCHSLAKRLRKSAKPDYVQAQNRAHKAVDRAVRLKLIVRQPCLECGEPKVEAHHEDYSKPLDVVWLCRTHHRRRHPRPSKSSIQRKALK